VSGTEPSVTTVVRASSVASCVVSSVVDVVVDDGVDVDVDVDVVVVVDDGVGGGDEDDCGVVGGVVGEGDGGVAPPSPQPATCEGQLHTPTSLSQAVPAGHWKRYCW